MFELFLIREIEVIVVALSQSTRSQGMTQTAQNSNQYPPSELDFMVNPMRVMVSFLSAKGKSLPLGCVAVRGQFAWAEYMRPLTYEAIFQ